MTQEAMAYWLRRMWGDPGDDVQRLLVLDEYKEHKSQAVRETAKGKKTDIVYIPGGYTSFPLPLDVYKQAI